MEKIQLPVLPIRSPDFLLFPCSFGDIYVGREFSIEALASARANKINLLLAFQKDPIIDEPEIDDLHNICVEAEIKDIVKNSTGPARVVLSGIKRAVLKDYYLSEGNFYVADIKYVKEPNFELTDDDKEKIKVLREIISTYFKSVVIKVNEVNSSEDLSNYVDNICGQLYKIFRTNKILLKLLKTKHPRKRLEGLFDIISKESKYKEVSFDMENDSEMDDDHPAITDIKKLHDQAAATEFPEEVAKVVGRELKRIRMLPPGNAEFQVTYSYLDTLIALPWNKYTEDKLDIEVAKDILNRDHYGMIKAKERILEFLAVKKLVSEKKGSILCFCGPPGVGKTSIARSIAEAVGRKFIRMSLGGISDEAEIRGHRKTYIGSMVGKIMQQIKRVGVKNPVFLLDEIDKISKNFKGDPAAALLEVLDPEQNSTFVDNYLGVPFDLSRVMFLATANDISMLVPALRDRLEIIEISGYSIFDKIKIAQNYLLPKQQKENGLKDYDITVSAKAIEKVIEEYTRESGVRSLERTCGAIMRKIAVMVASGKDPYSMIKADMIPNLLGPPKEYSEKAAERPEIGLSTGLAWSETGGSILFVECSLSNGKGKVILTGNLGKVIQESAQAAYTYIKSNSESLGIDTSLVENRDVHIHFPAGAIPKDGPSAGVALVSAMLSCFLLKPVRNDIAMTGEISLRGRVMPIGGLREKVLAADRAGISTVLYPKLNKYDLEEIPEDVRKKMKLIQIYHISEAIDLLLVDGQGNDNNELSLPSTPVVNRSI